MPFKKKELPLIISSNTAKSEQSSTIKARIIRVTDDRSFQLRPFRHRDVANAFVIRRARSTAISRLCRIDPLAGRSYRVSWTFRKKNHTFRCHMLAAFIIPLLPAREQASEIFAR